MKLEHWGTSNVGLVRKNNEDAVGSFPDARLFIVADGMGGRAEGEIASRMAVDVLHRSVLDFSAREAWPGATSRGIGATLWDRLLGRSLRRPPTDEDELGRLRHAVEFANRRIFEQGRGREQQEGAMGSTVVALLFAAGNARAHWAHVGDSRLYLLRDGDLRLLTADHTLLGEPYGGSERVPSDLPHTNRLTRALGVDPDVEVTLGSAEASHGDLYLLCSDGVSGMVKPEVLLDDLRSYSTLEAAGSALIAHALEAGGRDNASVLLVRLTGD